MRYLNIFFNVLILFLLLLFVFSLSSILLKSENLFFLRSLTSPNYILRFLWLNLILEHINFIITSFALAVISYFLFFNLSLFKSKTFFFTFLIPTLTIAVSVFCFEFFIFSSLKKNITSNLDNMKKDIVENINYEIFFKSNSASLNYFNTKFYMYIKSRNRHSASGYYADAKNLVFFKNFKFYLKDDKIVLQPQFIKHISSSQIISSIKLSFKDENRMKNLIFSPIGFSKYFFILFLILPVAVLFNNKNWVLKAIIFFSITLPVLLLLVAYYDKLCINVCSNFNIKLIKGMSSELFKNEFLLSMSYIVLGIFLFGFIGKIKDLIPRIEVEKIKRISG